MRRDILKAVGPDVEQLFERLKAGDESALNELTPALYSELHRIAAGHMRAERPGHTLQPTALVNEAYLKLFRSGQRDFTDHVHFLSLASRVMRQVLVDYARSRATAKRSDEAKRELADAIGGQGVALQDFIDVDGAIEALAGEDSSLARLVEMRYFGGMTAEETASALGLSVHSVRHDIRLAQAWIRRWLTRSANGKDCE